MHWGKRAASLTAVLAVAAALLAAPTTGANAAVIAAHPLGARRPTGFHAARAMMTLSVPPDRVDLRSYAVTPGNQGQVGSCVTWAIDYGMLGWYFNMHGLHPGAFQPMYTYSQINGGVDEGSSPIDALYVATTQGNDTKAHYGHGDFDWKDKPNGAEHANAANYKITGSDTLFEGAGQAQISDLLKNSLAHNKPVAIIISVRHGFDYMGHTSDAVDDDISTSSRGYHEVLALGYDAAGLIIENSWGTTWGFGGFGRLSWNVVQHDVYEGDTIRDLAAPTTTTPSIALLGAGTTANSLVPARVSWSATGLITSFEVSYQVDGAGDWTPVTLTSPTAKLYDFTAAIGHSYAFKVVAYEGADLVSSAKTSSAFAPTLTQETDAHIAYHGTWSATVAGQGVKQTNALGASAKLSVTGRRIAWIGPRGPKRGQARVYVDGVLQATVNTYAASSQSQQVLYAKNFTVAGSHTIQIVNLATTGHSYVGVDAFVVTG